MTSEKLIDYIGQIDDSIIAEANDGLLELAPKHTWVKWISVAAAAVACIIAAILLIPGQKPPDDFPNLPKLTIEEIEFNGGYEGHMAHDISELTNGNPWTENAVLETLPVFRNTSRYLYGTGTWENGLSAEEMLARAEEVADIMGLKINTSQTYPTPEDIEQIMQKLENSPGGASEEYIISNTTPFQATAECDGATIRIISSGNVILHLTPETVGLAKELGKLSVFDSFAVQFDYGSETIDGTIYENGLPLPSEYSFRYDTPYEQAKIATEYLFSEYGAFTGITKPGYNLFASYNIYGELTRLYFSVFENAGSLTERLLNYHFNNICFSPTDKGGLCSIQYGKTDLSQKIGDYPIITAAKARELLLQKHYITTVPEDVPDAESIASVELMYRVDGYAKVFMPYYRFLVELPHRNNGMKDFGAFYVPAVKAEFLENMPVWDGRFN